MEVETSAQGLDLPIARIAQGSTSEPLQLADVDAVFDRKIVQYRSILAPARVPEPPR
jgi:hypothetical protein